MAKAELEAGRTRRAGLLASVLAAPLLAACLVGTADANPPPLPASMMKNAAAAESAATPEETVAGASSAPKIDAQAAESETQVPAARPAAEDEGAELAAEVPAEEVGAKPADEWVGSDVGEISTRPVKAGAAENKDMAVKDVPAPQAVAPAPVQAQDAPVRVEAADAPAGTIDIVKMDEPTETLAEEATKAEGETSEEAEEPVVAGAPVTPVNESYSFLEALKASPVGVIRKVPSEPKIVTIKANFSDVKKADTTAGEVADEEADLKPVTSAVKTAEDDLAAKSFALLWVDGDQRSGDTLVKYYEPARVFFASGKECLLWAKAEALAGRALAANGKQPKDLSAACVGATTENAREYWLWRQRSGAFVRSTLLPAQSDLYRDVIRSWMVQGPEAYVTFPGVPLARQ